MSTHTYARKSYYGGWADASQGDPNLMVSIETAFPGYKFVARSHQDTTNIVFEADLTAPQVVTLDGVYTTWDPESTPPPLPLPHTEALGVDVSTTSQAFIDLLTVTATTKSSALTLYGEVSGSCTVKTASLEFQVVVDGTPVKGASIYANGSSGVTHYWDVSEGSHTFKLQWRVTAGSGRIRASSNSLEHAFLRIS